MCCLDLSGIQTSLKENNFANGSRKHARVFSTDIPYGCICGKIYTDRRGLIIHINTNLYGNVFKCCWCTRKFLTHYMLKCHVRRIHGVELDKQNKYGCAVCGKTFNFLAELRKHRGDVHRIVRESKQSTMENYNAIIFFWLILFQVLQTWKALYIGKLTREIFSSLNLNWPVSCCKL